MAITVQCSCGKRMGVGDGLAGKSVRCPQCGQSVFVTAAAPAAGKAGAKPASKGEATPSFYISPGKIVALVILAVLILSGAIFYYGPVKVWNQWEAIGPQAGEDVTDVLTFALQSVLSERGEWDPSKSHRIPQVEGEVMFFRPGIVMSMPEKVRFEGKSNQGGFTGTFNTKTREIEADVLFGGMSFAGMVDLAKATDKFHMTGRRGADGQPQAEVAGKKLKIVYREKKEDE